MAEYVIDVADYKDGEMRKVQINSSSVLVVKHGARFFVTGCECTHYQGPLEKGLLRGNEVMCPWHHAVFDLPAGQRTEPPALNDLEHYRSVLKGSELTISLAPLNTIEPQGKSSPSDKRQFVIVGGGAAGNAAAEELRRNGFKGKIVMLSESGDAPVDRPVLSKDYLAGKAEPGWVPLRKDLAWYRDRDIEIRLNTTVTGIDTESHMVFLQEGEPLQYSKLLLATGSVPFRLPVPGAGLSNVYTLRMKNDADRIMAAGQADKRCVIIGASFIGLEAASSLGSRGVRVTVVGIEKIPFDRILGEEVGMFFKRLHESNGISFRLETSIQSLVEKDGQAVGVELKGGEILPADFVLMGVGVKPATAFLEKSGFKLNERDKAVLVDETLKTEKPDIYAAGDIALVGNYRIEHWRVAEQHGILAARNMLGKKQSTRGHVPFFWTRQWGHTISYVGYAGPWEKILWRGDPHAGKFQALYMTGGRLTASTGCEFEKEQCAVEFILREKITVTETQLNDPGFDLVEFALESAQRPSGQRPNVHRASIRRLTARTSKKRGVSVRSGAHNRGSHVAAPGARFAGRKTANAHHRRKAS